LVEAESVMRGDELDVLEERLGSLFVRPEPRRQAELYLEALLSGAQTRFGLSAILWTSHNAHRPPPELWLPPFELW
jgi:hypothetical protein